MSAKVIARALGLDLLVVDSAAITSKFIGETAKNLTLAFEVARDAQCALMFEEADSFFTTRVKVETANDRHSNADIGHLLQLMEHHDGVVMLSSNRRTNMDPAFTRRLRFIVEFRKPGPAERQRLWDLTLAMLDMPINERWHSQRSPARLGFKIRAGLPLPWKFRIADVLALTGGVEALAADAAGDLQAGTTTLETVANAEDLSANVPDLAQELLAGERGGEPDRYRGWSDGTAVRSAAAVSAATSSRSCRPIPCHGDRCSCGERGRSRRGAFGCSGGRIERPPLW